MAKHTLGFVGAGGRMGFAMAKRLLAAGHEVSVYNRTRSKVAPLAALGAKVVDSVRELRGLDIVFTTVSASDDLLAVCTGPDGLLDKNGSPKLIIDCSSVSEEASAQVRAAAEKLGTAMLAAPVSGNAKVVAAGKLTIVASGPRQSFDMAEPYLQALGVGVTYVGEGELARMVKICHNLLLGVVAQSLAEITVLAEKGGVKRSAFLEFINNSVMGSQFSRYKTPAFVNLDWTPTFTPVLLRKDLDLGLKAAKELGVSLPVTKVTRGEVDKLVQAGHTDCDFAILIEQAATAAGLKLTPENVTVDDGLKRKLLSRRLNAGDGGAAVRLFVTLLATPTTVLLLLSSRLPAQEPVETEAATYILPVPIERNNPSYPRAELEQSREGWVMLSYIITPEGGVAEPMIENSSGGEAFEKAALQAISRWRYSPATRDGEPVEQSMVKTRVVFQLETDAQAGGTRTFRRTYAEAAEHIAAGNLDAALPLVDKLEFGTRVNLYEDAWFWWLKYLYLEASDSADNEEQIDALQLALGYEDDYLEPELFVAAAQSLFVLRVRVGDYSAARTTFLRLRDSRTAQRSERYEKTIALLSPVYQQIEDAVAGNSLLVVNAKIGRHDYWVHDLLRRSFSMANVTGRIDAVDIRCERATKRYDTFPADSVWHIPESWGSCGVYIKGEPGTTFKFEEYPAGIAATLLSQ